MKPTSSRKLSPASYPVALDCRAKTSLFSESLDMNQSYSSCESPDGIHLSPTYLVKLWAKRQSSHGYQNRCPKGPFLYHLEFCF